MSKAMTAQSKELLQKNEMLERKSGSLSLEYCCHTIDLVYIFHDLTLFLDIDKHTSLQQHVVLSL